MLNFIFHFSLSLMVSLTYDTDKARIKSITDQMGNKTEYQYYSGTTTAAEKMGLIKKELEHRKNSSGTLISNFNTTAYEYDTNGNRSKVIDNQSNDTIEVRDKANRLTSVTDAKGNVTTNTYDKLDRVTSTKDAKNQETKTYYDDINLVTKVVDREGKETTYTYDRKNQLKKVQYADETEKSYKYDAVGNKISETDAAGRITYYVYDKMNNMIATILPMQDDRGNNTYILKNEYDAEGRLTKTVDPKGVTVNSTYYKNGKKKADSQDITKVNPDGTTKVLTKKVDYVYDNLGNVKSVADNLSGMTIKYDYDDLGRKVAETVNEGLLDDKGNPAQMKTTYSYDIVKQTEELGKTENFAVTTVTDGLGNYTKSFTNELGQLRKTVKKGKEADLVTRTQFDELGRVLKEINPRGNTVTYEYDKLGRVLKKIAPDGTYVEKDYYPEGSVQWEKDARGNQTSYTYTPTYKVKEITNAKNKKTIYEYNPTGTVKSITDVSGNKTEFYYDDLDRAIKTIDPMGYESRVEYDWNGKYKRVQQNNRINIPK